MHSQTDAFIDRFLDGVDPWYFVTVGVLFLILGLVGLYPIRLESDIGSHGTFTVFFRVALLKIIAATIVFAGALLSTATYRIGWERSFDLWGDYLSFYWFLPFLALGAGLLIRFAWHRYVMPSMSNWWRARRQFQTMDTLSDITDELAAYPTLSYTPSDYYREGQVFVGLTHDGTPHYVELSEWRQTHKDVFGATGYGKGVTFQIWADQAIERGEAVWVIDPKHDRFMPQILAQTCARAGRKLLVLDLTAEAGMAWAPFRGGLARDSRSRFFSAMDLEDTGTNADYYKAVGRDALIDIWKGADRNIKTIDQALAALSRIEAGDQRHDIDRKTRIDQELKGLRSRLREWSEYRSLNPRREGFSVERALRDNAVVLVRGSLHDQVLRTATTMLIQEVMQEAHRLHGERPSHLAVFVDELRFLVSRAILDALATIRDRGVDVSVAFQNLGDLESPSDQRLDGDAVRQSVLVNGQIKMVFGGTDQATAEFISKNTGTQLKKIVLREQLTANRSGGETWEGHRTVGDEEEAVVTENAVLALPKGVGVLLRPRMLATIVGVSPVPVDAPAASAAAPAAAAVGHS